MFGNLGFGEIMIIMLVVLLFFGAKRLPEIGASIGKGMREFKRSLTERVSIDVLAMVQVSKNSWQAVGSCWPMSWFW